jgi:hypothetical protein
MVSNLTITRSLVKSRYELGHLGLNLKKMKKLHHSSQFVRLADIPKMFQIYFLIQIWKGLKKTQL